MTTSNFTEIELEIINLKAIIDTLNNMINHEVLDLRDSSTFVEVYFKSYTHQKYFNIILVDFLSPLDNTLIGKKATCLEILQSICEKPLFNRDNSILLLKESTNTFSKWIDETIQVETWFPSIDKSASLNIKRRDFIYICGNISKHNFARLTRVAGKLFEILNQNGISINYHENLLILNDFFDKYHSNILTYLVSYLTEMLNDIRWGIHEYLLPEFNLSYKIDSVNALVYSYTYPKGVDSAFGKACYCDLMKDIKSSPWVRKFKAPEYFKMRF